MKTIHQLEAEIVWIKIQVNSIYGRHPYESLLIENRTELKQELKRLKQIELRKEKIQKIKNKLCQ